MTKRLFPFLSLLLFSTLLATTHTTASVTTITTPQLKWAYGGCFTSWCETGWYASPAVADLDNDGRPEVIWGSYDAVALNGEDGTLQWRGENGSRVWPGVAVADLTGDGTLEVIMGRGSDQVTVYSNSGTELWTRNPFGSGEVRTLAVADLENDGRMEIIVGRASGGSTEQVNVFEADGSVRTGFPARRNGEPGYGWGMYNQNLTVGDVDNDGYKEIFAPTDTHYITALDRNGNQLPANNIYGAGKVWAEVGLHVSHDVDLRGYANCGTDHRPNFANAAPAISDVNGDGTSEIIILGDVYDCSIGDNIDGDLYIMPWILNLDRTRWQGDGFDWTAIPTPGPNTRPLSQDYTVIQNNVHNTVVADLDSDGFKEILFPAYDGQLHAYWLDKTQHGNWPYVVPGSGIRFASEPAVVDINADGQAEVIFTSWPENGGNRNGHLHILDYLGNELHRLDLPATLSGDWNGGLAAPTIDNIDDDADLEIVIGTVSSGVVAYDLPDSANARILWGTGRGSYHRTGEAPDLNEFNASLQSTTAVINAGDTAVFTIDITAGANFTDTVTLSVNDIWADLDVSLSTTEATPPAQVDLTITDLHPAGELIPGIFTEIPIQLTGGGREQTMTVYLLVGGTRSYLPLTIQP